MSAPERIWSFLGVTAIYPFDKAATEYLRADIAASQLAEARAEAERWAAQALKEEECRIAWQAERERLAADNARLREALEGACDQILDSYRTWVADDTEAHPRPGQIPRYDAARDALAGKE